MRARRAARGPPPMQAMPMPLGREEGVAACSTLVGGVAGDIADGFAALGGRGYGAKRDEAPPEDLPARARRAWLDFDALRVMPAGDPSRRGRLPCARSTPQRPRARVARAQIGETAAPGAQRPAGDPRDVRPPVRGGGPRGGAADALTHRVSLGRAR